MKFNIEENRLEILIEKEVYSLDVVKKCFYSYQDNFSVEINNFSDNKYKIILEGDSNKVFNNIFFSTVRQNLFDADMREKIRLETKNIRELIIAKAFFPFYKELEL